MTDQQETPGMSQWEAQKRFGELLTATPVEEAVSPEDAPVEGEIEASEDEAIEIIDEEVDEIEASDDEQESDEVEDASDTYTVVVSGDEVEVTLPELIAGYSRQQDYTRKTQEVAEGRKALESELSVLRQERQQYAAALPRLQEMIQSAIPPRPNPNEYTDPLAYQRADRQWEDQKANLEAVNQERARIAEQQRIDAEAQWQEVMQQEQQALLNKVPEWQDTKVRTKETQEMAEYLQRMGYNEQEVTSLIDHRAVLIARKAMAYDNLNVKAKAKPRRSKTVAPGSTSGVKRTTKTTDIVERAKQTGSENDAARAFAQLLG